MGVGTVRPVFPRAAAAACSRKDLEGGKRAILIASGTRAMREEQ